MVRRTFFPAVLLASALIAMPAIAQTASPQLAAAVADPSRPAADTARDANRKPLQVIAFAGVKPGDKVADLIPISGYFTRIFAKLVGPSGHVYAATPQALASRPGALDATNAIAAANPNVTAGIVDFAKMDFPEKLDVIWTSENYHDFHNFPGVDVVALDKVMFNALKPGGVLYIEDHQTAPGVGATATNTLHRIEADTVIKEVEAAGFKLEARSDVLANPADPHTAGVFSPEIRGKTDKFVLKFRKPK
jgi:predicted methyltransferase